MRGRRKHRGVRAARLRAVKDDIARILKEGDVSVATVAARHRVSPRYLHKLFEREGVTFSEFVLDQRLTRAHRLLSDPRRAQREDRIGRLGCGLWRYLLFLSRVPPPLRSAADRRARAGARLALIFPIARRCANMPGSNT